MQNQTILLIVLALAMASGLAYLQYKNNKTSLKRRLSLGILRFFMLFSGLLLLINPQFTQTSYTSEKPNLVLLADASSSISHMGAATQIRQAVTGLSQNPKLKERFKLHAYAFADGLVPLTDSLAFAGNATDIAKALGAVKETFGNQNNAVVLLTDGIQTLGKGYAYLALGANTHLNAVVVGDTTAYDDLSIKRVNSNRYAFLDNQFPLEVQLNYSGSAAINTNLTVSIDQKVVHRQKLSFTKNQPNQVLDLLLKAQSTGVKTISLVLDSFSGERNTVNNKKIAVVEVVDEKTVVGIVSAIKHPDIATLKKAITANEQRKVVVLSPTATPAQLAQVDVFVLYQPQRSFEPIYKLLANKGGGRFTITGTQTDWTYLNSKNQGFALKSYGQTEEIAPFKNAAFSSFDLSGFAMEDFPPLAGQLGELQFQNAAKVIAHQKIRGAVLEAPLFLLLESQDKQAVLLGENLWKWRLQTYRDQNNFNGFDAFMGKLMLYLASSGKKQRLQLSYEQVFQNASEAIITASFFDKAYNFEDNANLQLSIKGANGFARSMPMLRSANQYQAELGNLAEGEYTFTVTETEERIAKSGRFRVLTFDVEKQLTASDDDKLQNLAKNNGGHLFYPDQLEAMVDSLMQANTFVPIQKRSTKLVSLIDFRWVLAFMTLCLALEWFIRKYNGLQ